MAKKTTTNDEDKAIMSTQIATDTEVYLAAGGTVKRCTHRDNANFCFVKKSKKQHLEEQKRRGLLSVINHQQRKQNAAEEKT